MLLFSYHLILSLALKKLKNVNIFFVFLVLLFVFFYYFLSPFFSILFILFRILCRYCYHYSQLPFQSDSQSCFLSHLSFSSFERLSFFQSLFLLCHSFTTSPSHSLFFHFQYISQFIDKYFLTYLFQNYADPFPHLYYCHF